ncbi:MAG: helix-turn-helix domain-containing protein, partial [Candidatus Omnitrophota bacterium]
PETIINQAETAVFKPDEIYNKAFASLKDVLKEPEKIHILKVLKEVGGNKKKAALKLGVNRTTLYNKMRQYEIVSDKNN